jgi:hypothetical protein
MLGAGIGVKGLAGTSINDAHSGCNYKRYCQQK